jgi:pimeloyl-ACP methyl ester carboxylesterase
VTPSTDVNWQLDDIEMFGTFTAPEGDGPFPALVLVAGSGPTDRDWNSPLLPGTNGSGRLLAEALADAGFASLRYDKRASGPHVAENLPRLSGRLSLASHLDELAAAIGALAAQASVDPARIVGLGNSEGCLHLLRYATSAQSVPLAGLVLTAPPGRSIGEVLLRQLSTQLGFVPGGAELMPLVEAAAARYAAGEPMDLDPALPEPLRQVMASFEAPANLPFARELWALDAADLLPLVTVPTLVLIGGKDLQVDVTLDGEPLRAAAAGRADVEFVFPPTANHVLKEEVRTTAEIAAAGGAGYNTEGTRLDPEALAAIIDWLRAH